MSKISLGTDEGMNILEKALDHNAARQKVAARNLANCDTEGYQPKSVKFVDEMNRAFSGVDMARTDPRHLALPRSADAEEGLVEVVDDEWSDEIAETKLERSMTELADAELAYSTAARLMSKRSATVRTAMVGKP